MSANTETTTVKRGELFVYISYISAIRSRSSKCKKLLQILDSNQVKYTVIDLGIVPEKINEMLKYNGGIHDLPQVFVDTKFIGTFDDVEEWIEEERLLTELQQAGYKGGPNPPHIDQEEVHRINEEFKTKFPEEVLSEEAKQEKLSNIEKMKTEKLEQRKKLLSSQHDNHSTNVAENAETTSKAQQEKDEQEEEEPLADEDDQYDDDDQEEEEDNYVRKYDPNRDSDDEYY
ncbi:hypothetical protein FDP41_003489 [Naegleria fowleri]|uniref:Glutaredoxin domain-containing protein n=1 Tax=Naegleria fowleri TaxID=5763 RepID=A0A6A5BKH2_NAEFO|nr:uncharacterized protein FDP41_003489 [Naegleria fowleri]KAF0977497.1 hypothetical protein FDP41_003489 [Naegleria fowleri]CAG4710746.1 unnamed protein product [Naegleria fowleri]